MSRPPLLALKPEPLGCGPEPRSLIVPKAWLQAPPSTHAQGSASRRANPFGAYGRGVLVVVGLLLAAGLGMGVLAGMVRGS